MSTVARLQPDRQLHPVRCPTRSCARLLVHVCLPARLHLSEQIDVQVRCRRCKHDFAVVIRDAGLPRVVQLD